MKRLIIYATSIFVGILIVAGLVLAIKGGKTGARNKTAKQIESASLSRIVAKPQDTVVTKTKQVKGEIDVRNAFIEVANTVGSAVVAISTERTQKVQFPGPGMRFKRFGSPFGDEDPFEKFFEDFFGRMPEKEFKEQGLGTGFIVDNEGHILTNNHVVEGADKIMINLPDGRSFTGEVKGADARSDLAIVKVDAKNLPFVELGNSDLVQTGEWVVALGNPFGHVLKSPKPTVTVGVISALHRRIPMPGGETGYIDMIQTDAAINPGNSGGPLCDLNGTVIGINVAIFSTTGGYQGVGFAIPINVAKDILADLIKGKEITYGWLGVSVQEVTPEIAEYFNLPDQKGALIAQIIPDSPADKGGLKEGDIILGFEEKEIASVHDLLRAVANKKVGEKATVDIIRDKIKKSITVTIEKRKPTEEERAMKERITPEKEAGKWRGITASELTDALARELNTDNREGVVIIGVERNSPSSEAGLMEGDIIREINKSKVKSLSDFKTITGEARGLVLIRTDRGYFTVKNDEKK